MSISNNSNNELVCTVKIGLDPYRKNYIYLASTAFAAGTIFIRKNSEELLKLKLTQTISNRK